MALSTRALTRISTGTVGLASGAAKTTHRGISVYAYGTDDAAATVEAAGYFNGSRGELVVGDIILATMANGGTPVLKPYVVTAVPATGNVTIALGSVTGG